MTTFLETYKQLLSLSKRRSGYNNDTLLTGPIMKNEIIPGEEPEVWHEVERKLTEIQGSSIAAFPNYSNKSFKGDKSPPMAWRDSLKNFNLYSPEVIIHEIELAISLANDAAKISEREEKSKEGRKDGIYISLVPLRSFLHKVKIDVSDRAVKLVGWSIFVLLVSGLFYLFKHL